MSFYISRSVPGTFESVMENIKEQLHSKDYLIAADIDVQGALKQRLGAELQQISIIGTNTPNVGLKLFNTDPKLGTLLPFSIVLNELNDGKVEVSMIDPEFLFQEIDNPGITQLGVQVKSVFTGILNSL